MDKDPFKNKLSQEKLALKIEIALEKDWESYKNLRLEAINGADKDMFGPKAAARDREKTDEEWQDDLVPQENKFTVLSWAGSLPVGMGAAREKEETGFWHVGSDYVKPEHRGGTGRKILAFRLKEIINRGGKKVEAGIKPGNRPSMRLYESIGFNEAGVNGGWQMVEIDLTDPEVISRIDGILNAG
jgi:ribosomal protein S18 acetylase RimI-like enzyme